MYSYDYQFRLIVVGDSTVGKVSRIAPMKLSCTLLLRLVITVTQLL